MKITPEVLDSMPNPKFLALTQNLEVDIPSFFKIYNPYKIAHYASFGIPELVEVFMTANQFAGCRPIPEVFELVKNGAKRFERFLDKEYVGNQLLYLIDVSEFPKLQMDPWVLLPEKFECTSTTRNKFLTNLKTMQTWDAAKVKTLVESHVKLMECKKDNCLFANLI